MTVAKKSSGEKENKTIGAVDITLNSIPLEGKLESRFLLLDFKEKEVG